MRGGNVLQQVVTPERQAHHVQYNRAGDIFRKITFKDVFPIQQPDFVDELSYENQDAAELTMVYRCDHWVEENVGA